MKRFVALSLIMGLMLGATAMVGTAQAAKTIKIAGMKAEGEPETIGMPIQSYMFKFFTQIQDEVHRFAITFHRDKRSKNQTKSELDTIKGIGEKTKILLLHRFKSVKRIREADFDELKAVIGEAKAHTLINGLKKGK